MNWLVGILLLLILPTAEVAAQEVNALMAGSVSSLSASSPAAPRPTPQVIRDDAVRDTWELGLGFTVVRFGSSVFDSTMSGLDTTVSYYVRDHVAVEGSITSTFGSSSSRTGASRYVFYGTGVKLSAVNRKLQLGGALKQIPDSTRCCSESIGYVWMSCSFFGKEPLFGSNCCNYCATKNAMVFQTVVEPPQSLRPVRWILPDSTANGNTQNQ
jgi:hypothetical protein